MKKVPVVMTVMVEIRAEVMLEPGGNSFYPNIQQVTCVAPTPRDEELGDESEQRLIAAAVMAEGLVRASRQTMEALRNEGVAPNEMVMVPAGGAKA